MARVPHGSSMHVASYAVNPCPGPLGLQEVGKLGGVVLRHVDGVEQGAGGLLLLEAFDALLSRADKPELIEHLLGQRCCGGLPSPS